MSISFLFGSQRKHSFQWNMGFSPVTSAPYIRLECAINDRCSGLTASKHGFGDSPAMWFLSPYYTMHFGVALGY